MVCNMEEICFLFGHRDAPDAAAPLLDAALEHHYTVLGARVFLVGSRGHFDALAAAALQRLKTRRPDVQLLLLLAYHPEKQTFSLPAGFDGSLFPEGMEKVPPRLAIIRANTAALRQAASVICWVEYPGNTRNLLQSAEARIARGTLAVTNLADAAAAIRT